MAASRAWRLCALLALPPALAFAGLMGAAMVHYPGGTWEEPSAHGHRFWSNYFCDLMRPVALNGEPNPAGSRLSGLGLLALAVTLLPFFLSVPALFERRVRTGRFVRIAGVLSFVGGVGVVLAPSHRVGALVHGVVLLVAAVPGIGAAVGAVVGLWSERTRHPWVSGLAVLTVALAVATALVFIRQLQLGVESTPPLAPLQKLLAASALAWICVASVRVARA